MFKKKGDKKDRTESHLFTVIVLYTDKVKI